MPFCKTLTRSRETPSEMAFSPSAALTATKRVARGSASRRFARGPNIEALLEAIRRTETPEIFDEKSLRWGFEKLSQSESKVLDGVLAGKGSREIAFDLGISFKTVEAHRCRINAKTRARDLGELVRMWKAWQALE